LDVGPASLIGCPLPRREDDRLLRGQGRYLDDIEPQGVGHVSFVRSEYAHARIHDIRLPTAGEGLIATLTAADLADSVRSFPTFARDGAQLADEPHPVLARTEVRYLGQPVAAVVATSRALAEDLAARAEVDYESLQPIVDAAGSSHELMRWSRSGGDVGGAFASAAHVVRGRYRLPRLVAAPIEPRGCVADHDASGDRLTVWCSAQDTHRPRAQLAHILRREPASIRVRIPDVGGAFGSKGVIAPEIATVAAAAIRFGRPMKWAEDRYENFVAAYQGRGIDGELELALDADGRMLALRARLLADLGAYLLPLTAVAPHTAALLLTGCYEIPAAEVDVVGVRTNKPPTGPYRGAGRPEATYMIESLIDDAARSIGADRIELRRRNLIRRFPYATPLGYTYDSGDYERCLDRVLELQRASAPPPPPPGRLRGTGIAMYVERAGGQWESAELSVGADGTVLVRSSSSPHGQGHDTTFMQIAATTLGLQGDRIVLRFGDSDEVPPGVGTFGSRSVAVGGSAVALAAERLLERGRELAADALGTSLEQVELQSGRFVAGAATLEWTELAAIANPLPVAGSMTASGSRPPGGWSASARFEAPPVFSSGAYGATVEVDPTTGELHVLQIAAIDDAGVIINPLLSHGQVIGGIVQGLGECLVEEARYDDSGSPLDISFMQYGLLTSADVPPIATDDLCTPSPIGPLGAKGVGEGGTIGTVAAVANAVADALGGRRLDPPFTDQRLWSATR
jgi:carbon-monoxide dehydrogenase large subunit